MKLLLTIDGSESGTYSAAEVAARRWPAGSTVEVLTVVEPSHLWTVSVTAEQVVGKAQSLVAEVAGKINAGGALAATGVVMQGDPKTVIVDRARSQKMDMVVVGSHGSSALRRFLLGSVAASVVRYAPCSVEIIRKKTHTASTTFGVRRILLATDGSELSLEAARAIASRPWPSDIEVRVLSAIEYIMPTAQLLLEPAFFLSDGEKELQNEAMTRAQDAVMSAIGVLQPVFPNITESVSVLIRPPKEVILSEADEWDADLIFMGSHGRRGADHFLLGSVSEAVATHASCSVEVVRKRST